MFGNLEQDHVDEGMIDNEIAENYVKKTPFDSTTNNEKTIFVINIRKNPIINILFEAYSKPHKDIDVCHSVLTSYITSDHHFVNVNEYKHAKESAFALFEWIAV